MSVALHIMRTTSNHSRSSKERDGQMSPAPAASSSTSSHGSFGGGGGGGNFSASDDQQTQQIHPSSLLTSLFQRMNPKTCLMGSGTGSRSSSSGGGGDAGGLGGIIPSMMMFSDEETEGESAPLLDEIIPEIIHDISKNEMKRSSAALRRLYQLTDSSNKSNRVPIVCTNKWDIISTLSSCLILDFLFSGGNSSSTISSNNNNNNNNHRRLACLTLNNLSIPFENKAVMVLGPTSTRLLSSLVTVIRRGHPESYLCCICLMNLSYLEDAKKVILYFSPTTAFEEHGGGADVEESMVVGVLDHRADDGGDGDQQHDYHFGNNERETNTTFDNNNMVDDTSYAPPGPRTAITTTTATPFSSMSYIISPPSLSPLDEPFSLLRTIEYMMKAYSNIVSCGVLSVEGEAIRWSTGLIRNLSDREENANLIAKTDIPCLIVGFVRDSPHPLSRWTRDSLEDLSLLVLCNLARWSESREVLRQARADEAVSSIIGLGGIHDFRATIVRCSLES